MALCARDASVPGEKGTLQRLCERDVGRVVGTEATAQVERPAAQRVAVRPPLHGQVLEVGQGVVRPGLAEAPVEGQPPQRGDDLEVEERRRVQLFAGQARVEILPARAVAAASKICRTSCCIEWPWRSARSLSAARTGSRHARSEVVGPATVLSEEGATIRLTP